MHVRQNHALELIKNPLCLQRFDHLELPYLNESHYLKCNQPTITAIFFLIHELYFSLLHLLYNLLPASCTVVDESIFIHDLEVRVRLP
jgi:hypothetical protein